MDFSINDNELSALYGLPHIQQMAYLRGIRPYMDAKTGMVGIKRGISYQSIAEQLYIEPHPGIKSVSYSRAQMIRAVAGLERAGLISLQSGDLKLILKCEKATLHFSVQNKAVTNPSQKADIFPITKNSVNTGFSEVHGENPDTGITPKAVIPHKDNNYLYFLSAKFEKFWESYPEQKSQPKAWEAFQKINPDETLFSQMMDALEKQKAARKLLESQGSWVPAWKYPANWLSERCFEEAITEVMPKKEYKHANEKNNRQDATRDPFAPDWDEYADCPEEACSASEDAGEHDNIVQLYQYR